MANENTNSEARGNQDCADEKKAWSAPQLIAVSIAGLTEHMFNFGSDTGGASTLS